MTPPRETLGLPNCTSECKRPTCVELARSLMGEVSVYEVNGEVCGIPPVYDSSFAARAQNAIVKLRLCAERIQLEQGTPPAIEAA